MILSHLVSGLATGLFRASIAQKKKNLSFIADILVVHNYNTIWNLTIDFSSFSLFLNLLYSVKQFPIQPQVVLDLEPQFLILNPMFLPFVLLRR